MMEIGIFISPFPITVADTVTPYGYDGRDTSGSKQACVIAPHGAIYFARQQTLPILKSLAQVHLSVPKRVVVFVCPSYHGIIEHLAPVVPSDVLTWVYYAGNEREMLRIIERKTHTTRNAVRGADRFGSTDMGRIYAEFKGLTPARTVTEHRALSRR